MFAGAGVWWQDISKCKCVEPPLCPPPKGDNGGDPTLPTVCGDLPDPIREPDPPPPPWTGWGPIREGDFDVPPPWPPEPPRITGPTIDIPQLPVWVCIGYTATGPKRCTQMSSSRASANHPTVTQHATQEECQITCREILDPTTSTDRVWVCVGEGTNRSCQRISRIIAEDNWSDRSHHSTKEQCDATCRQIIDPRITEERVWVCTGQSPNKVCQRITKTSADYNWPDRPQHASRSLCQAQCINIDEPDDLVWVCTGGAGTTQVCRRMSRANASSNWPGRPQYETDTQCRINCLGLGDVTEITDPPPEWVDMYQCMSVPTYECVVVRHEVGTPIGTGMFETEYACEQGCQERVKRITHQPNPPVWVCIGRKAGLGGVCTLRCKQMNVDNANDVYPNRIQHNTLNECKALCKCTDDEAERESEGEDRMVDYWNCTGAPEWKCVKTTISILIPPGPGSHRNKEECQSHCKPLEGPRTGVGSRRKNYWQCTGHPQWKCNIMNQSIHLPPPPGSWTNLDDCETACKPGPESPGPAGPAAPKGGGGGGGPASNPCRCRVISSTTEEVPSGPTSPGPCVVTRYKYTAIQACRQIENNQPRHTGDPTLHLAMMNSNPAITVTSENVTTLGQNCATTAGCTDNCPDIVIEYKITYCTGDDVTTTDTFRSLPDDNGGGGTKVGGGDVVTGTSTDGGSNGTSVEGEATEGTLVDTNNNLPSVLVPTNTLDPYDGGVYRPETQTNSNLPATPVITTPPVVADVVGVVQQPSANLPTGVGAQGIANAYDSAEASQTEPFVEYLKFDPAMQIYDIARNPSVQSSPNILSKAEMRTKAYGDPSDVLNSQIRTTLNDLIRTQGGSSFVPYNGVTAGSFMFHTSLVKDALNQTTRDALDFVKHQNLFTFNLETYLVDAVKEAILKGRLEDYSSDLILEMGNTSKSLWPRGLPRVAGANKQEAAYNLIRQIGRSLNPRFYKGNGNAQQTVRRTRQVPTDIDLTLPIVTRGGLVTGVRFNNTDGIPISTTGGTIVHPTQQNEYFNITKTDGTIDRIELKSNRDKAYAFDSNQKNVIDEMLNSIGRGGDNGVTFELSTTPPSTTDIEVEPNSVVIPEILVFSGMRNTLEEVGTGRSDMRTTQMTYELAWKEGDSDAVLNDLVAPWVGPRAIFYIPSNDPIWNYILSPVDSEGRTYIKTTMRSLNIPLDGKIYPRQIFTDFAIAPTDVTRYDPLQGGSQITKYTAGENIKRSITMLPSPLLSVQNETYVKSVRDDTAISGERSVYGMRWAKGFRDGEYTQKLSKTRTKFTTDRSALATIFQTIKRIDTNYNLKDGYEGKRLPMGDLVSFLTLPEFIEMFRIPPDIRFSLFNGVYNNIKVYPLLKDAREKTYITVARLTGLDLTKFQIQVLVPELSYFDSRYKGKLF